MKLKTHEQFLKDFYLKNPMAKTIEILDEYRGNKIKIKCRCLAEQNFAKTQYNDKIKNKYCQDNNIFLLRIGYWDFKNIEQILNKHLFSS